MTTHSILSPSASGRWLACADSVRVNATVERKSSKYADEGTAAHKLLELCLRFSISPEDLHGTEMHGGYAVTEEMGEAIEHARQYIHAWQTKHPQGKVYLEHELHWGKDLRLKPEVSSGTADVVLVGATECVIMDYKHGAGVAVDPQKNTQLMLYAQGAASSVARTVRKFRLCVVQPRARHIEGPVREWHVTRDELWEWAQRTVAPQARLILVDKSRKRVAGEHCRWCAAQGTCKALKEYSMEAAKHDFDAIEECDTAEMTPEEIGELLAVLPTVENWIRAVYAHALDAMLRNPEAIPNWKLVLGRAPGREWLNEKKVIETCRRAKLDIDAYAPRSLLSPAKMESLVPYKGKEGKAKFRQLYIKHITRGQPTPHIAPADDPRPAYRGAATDFEQVVE